MLDNLLSPAQVAAGTLLSDTIGGSEKRCIIENYRRPDDLQKFRVGVVSATFVDGDGTENKNAVDADNDRDHRIIRLVELMHRLHSEDDAQKSLRNLSAFLRKECPNELLPVLRRISSWDKSPYAAFLYAKAAFETQQPKLAYKVISPFLENPDAAETAVLLGARICARLGNRTSAGELLARIPASSRLSKGVDQVRKLLERPEHSKKTETVEECVR